jgi:hypothetical protein
MRRNYTGFRDLSRPDSTAATTGSGVWRASRSAWHTAAVDPRDILAYLNRDWDAVRAVHGDYWARQKKKLGAAEGLRISDELRREAVARGGDFTTREQREEDLRAHQRVSRVLCNAAKNRRG